MAPHYFKDLLHENIETLIEERDRYKEGLRRATVKADTQTMEYAQGRISQLDDDINRLMQVDLGRAPTDDMTVAQLITTPLSADGSIANEEYAWQEMLRRI